MTERIQTTTQTLAWTQVRNDLALPLPIPVVETLIYDIVWNWIATKTTYTEFPMFSFTLTRTSMFHETYAYSFPQTLSFYSAKKHGVSTTYF